VVWVVWVVVTAAVDIFSVVLVMGDCFLGEKVVSGKMGMTGVAGLLNGEFGHDEIGVLILDCWIRMEIGSGLLFSESNSCLRGLVSSVCLSSE
jgi:hypothetical protein